MSTLKLLVVIVGAVIATITTVALAYFKCDDNIVAGAGGAIGSIIVSVFELWEKRHQTKDDKLDDLIAGGSFANPWYLSLYFLFLLLLVPRLLAYPVSWIVSTKLGFGYFPKGTSLLVLQTVMAATTIWLILAFNLPITVLLAKRLAHRIKKWSAVWLSVPVVLQQVISILITILYLRVALGKDVSGVWASVVASWKDQTFIIFLFLVAVWIGCAWAKHTQDEFMMGNFYGQLNRNEKEKILTSARDAVAAQSLPPTPSAPPTPTPIT